MPGRAHYTEPFEDSAGEWRWSLKAANGEIVCASEGYETKAGAHRAIKDHHRAAAEAVIPLVWSADEE